MTVRYEANKPVSTYWTSLLRQCSRTNVRAARRWVGACSGTDVARSEEPAKDSWRALWGLPRRKWCLLDADGYHCVAVTSAVTFRSS
jgi:hypothetical protein